MAQVLTQAEVDALLAAVLDENLVGDTKPKFNRLPRIFDLTEGGQGLHRSLPVLDMISSRFAKILRSHFSNVLRCPIDVKLASVATVAYGDLIKTMQYPACVGVVEIANLGKPMAVSLEGELLFGYLEVLFGNSREPGRAFENKELTKLEINIASQIIQNVLTSLGSAWKSVEKIHFEFKHIETNPQYLTFAQSDDLIIVHNIHVSFADVGAKLKLIYPLHSIDSLKPKLKEYATGMQKPNNEWAQAILSELENAEVEVNAVISSKEMRIKDLMALKVGDVINFENYKHGHADICISGNKKFEASVVQDSGRQMVKIKRGDL